MSEYQLLLRERFGPIEDLERERIRRPRQKRT